MVMKIRNIADIHVNEEHSPVVFITGVTGQDGSHMIDYLLRETNASIIGGARRLSVENHDNIRHLEGQLRFQLVNFDLTDSHSIYKLMEVSQPDYFINFAAQSFVASSWDFARQTWQTNSTAVLDCLEAIRRVKPTCRFYNAGSSEEFGNVLYSPQDENHPPRPRSPYGASKSAARTLVKVYRESYGLYAVQGWLFNHEGIRRGEDFVTRKITKGVARIRKSLFNGECFDSIKLGNVDAKRDWSDAEDMIDAVWKMMNQEECITGTAEQIREGSEPWTGMTIPLVDKFVPKDYVVSSDENHSIRDFVEIAFKYAGIQGKWMGSDLEEIFGNEKYGSLASIDPKFYRPAEIEVLCGNSSAIRKELGWKPKTSFEQLVKKMVENDLKNYETR
jgi:GDPmannose 4,6-dehydratase